jgi:outer membrane protein OmpA-like peptidoglycan-associated protein
MHRRTPALLILTALLPATALAQDADTFDISGSNLDGQGTLQRHDPHLDDRPTWYAGLGLVHANDPLVLIDGNGEETVVVGGQTSARIQAGYNFSGKVRLDVDIPTYPSVVVNGEGQFAMGDIRVGALVPIIAYDDEGVGLAVTPYVTLPTGAEEAYVTNGGMGGGLVASVGGQSGKVGWVVDAGVDLGRAATLGSTTTGSAIDAGVGVNYRVADPFVLGVELDQALNLSASDSRAGNPMEGHVYGTYGECGGFYATGALGTGIVAGVGSPDIRLAAVLGWRGAECGPFDEDGDGIMDDVDACPQVPEAQDGYLDEDGCPDVKPQAVRVTKEKIEIDEKILFQTGKATILAESYGILDSVAQVMRDYPKIRIRIEGHTDSQGSESYNEKLSDERAASVFRYLVNQGIAPKRMSSIGKGEGTPIDTNRTAAGRAANRWVEFHIVDGM